MTVRTTVDWALSMISDHGVSDSDVGCRCDAVVPVRLAGGGEGGGGLTSGDKWPTSAPRAARAACGQHNGISQRRVAVLFTCPSLHWPRYCTLTPPVCQLVLYEA